MNFSGYEIIHYGKVRHINIFMASITYRDFHMHSAWELGILEQGRACIKMKNQDYIMEPGSLIVLNPNQVHAIKSIGPPTLFLYVQFSNNFLSEYLPKLSKIEFQNNGVDRFLSDELRGELRRELHEAAYAYLYETDNYDMKCVGAVCDLFYTILRHMPYRAINSAEYSIQKKKTKRINRITSYMEEHYGEPLRLADLASREEVSPTYLSHFFHESMNMTFQEYLNAIRLDRAVQLVSDPNLSAADICDACGISDSRFLNKMLQNRYGYTLKEYRTRMAWDTKVRESEHYTPSVQEDCFFLTDENAKQSMLAFCQNGERLP
jgi:AraC-like DNA-binding protein